MLTLTTLYLGSAQKEAVIRQTYHRFNNAGHIYDRTSALELLAVIRTGAQHDLYVMINVVKQGSCHLCAALFKIHLLHSANN